MSRAVYEDDVIKLLNRGLRSGMYPLACDVRALPSAQPERPKGRWIEYDNSHCECPFCHEEWSYFDNEVEHFDFCPKCGADLRGEHDDSV